MQRHRLADDWSGAADEVEDAGRQADLVQHVGQHEGVQRRDFGGLQHDRAARRQRGRDLRSDLVQRVVPGRDRADDADRLTHDQRVADLLLPDGVGHYLRHRAEAHCRQSGLDHVRELDRHAELLRDQRGDLLHPRAERLRDPREPVGALVDRGQRPCLERCARGSHRAIDVVRAAVRDAAHHLLGRRVDDLNHAAAGGGDPLTTDVDAVAYVDALLGRGRHQSVLLGCTEVVGFGSGAVRSGSCGCGTARRGRGHGLGVAVGERHDRDHRVGARRGGEGA